MSGYTAQRHHDRGVLSRTYYREDALPPASLWDRAQQPSVLVPLILFLFGLFYNSLHKSPLDRHRHPGQVLWDIIVTLTPSSLLYFLDDYLHPPASSATVARAQTYTAKSDALRRILGLDNSSSIIHTVASAGLRRINSLANSSLLGSMVAVKAGQPAGLFNPGNECYRNSIVQGLSTLPPFHEFLSRVEPYITQVSGPDERKLASKLRDLVDKLTSCNDGQSIRPSLTLDLLKNEQQEDAHEYLLLLLSRLADDQKAAASILKSRSSPGLALDAAPTALPSTASVLESERDPLEGIASESLTCIDCGFSEGERGIPLNCLTIDVSYANQLTLSDGLDSWCNLDTLEDVHCPKCTLLKMQRLLRMIIDRGVASALPEESLAKPRARLAAVEEALEQSDFDDKTLEMCEIESRHYVKSTKTKQQKMLRPPKCLAVHINRSIYDPNNFQMVKNPAPVNFPTLLDLGPWTMGSAGGGGTDLDPSVESSDTEYWTSKPGQSQVSGSDGHSKNTGPIYKLRSVVVHRGQHNSGHYICYKQRPWRNPNLSDEDATAESDVASPITKQVFGCEEKSCHPPPMDVDDDVPMQWWCLSDTTVYRVDANDVTEGQQRGVFMLFYEMVDEAVRTSTIEEQATQVDAELAQGQASEAETEPASSLDGEAPVDLTPETSEGESVEPGAS